MKAVTDVQEKVLGFEIGKHSKTVSTINWGEEDPPLPECRTQSRICTSFRAIAITKPVIISYFNYYAI